MKVPYPFPVDLAQRRANLMWWCDTMTTTMRDMTAELDRFGVVRPLAKGDATYLAHTLEKITLAETLLSTNREGADLIALSILQGIKPDLEVCMAFMRERIPDDGAGLSRR